MKLARLLLTLLLLLALAGCANMFKDEETLDRERSEEQIYRDARNAARQGDFETAVEELEKLHARFPFGTYSAQAQLDMVYTYFRAEEWDSAISAADRFIRLNPGHPRVDYAHYMKASANIARGEDLLSRTFRTKRALRDPQPLRQAFADFHTLVTQFPNSRYAADARARMLVLRNQLAEHELYVARFYLEREAYVAAANRAKGVVESFQETPAVREALEILAQSYEGLELDDLRQDVLRVIRMNYPDHPLARG